VCGSSAGLLTKDAAAIIRVVFERLTIEARSALQRGHAEGRALGATHISSSHYLFGLIGNGAGLGAQVLRSLKLSAEEVKGCLVGDDTGRPPAVGMAPVSDEAKEALRAADEFSGGGDIGSDHHLLGLVMSPDRVAAQMVTRLGVEPAAIRDELTRLGGSDS
jgi:ATP-dependent Clp protease ATP-binding subunit ClpC